MSDVNRKPDLTAPGAFRAGVRPAFDPSLLDLAKPLLRM